MYCSKGGQYKKFPRQQHLPFQNCGKMHPHRVELGLARPQWLSQSFLTPDSLVTPPPFLLFPAPAKKMTINSIQKTTTRDDTNNMSCSMKARRGLKRNNKSSFQVTVGKKEKEVLPLGQMPPWLLDLGEPT